MELSEALITGKGVELGEALSEGLKVTGLGLGIVFAVLIILMIVLVLMRVVFYRPQKSQTVENTTAAAAASEPEAVHETEDDLDDEELIAVLTAAAAACMNTSTYNLRIKSYRRVNNNTPAWNTAGLKETINSRSGF